MFYIILDIIYFCLIATNISKNSTIEVDIASYVVDISHEMLITNGFITINNKKYLLKNVSYKKIKYLFKIEDNDLYMLSNAVCRDEDNVRFKYMVSKFKNWNILLLNVKTSLIDNNYIIDEDHLITCMVVNTENYQPTLNKLKIKP